MKLSISEPNDVYEWLSGYEGGIKSSLHSLLNGVVGDGVDNSITPCVRGLYVKMNPFKPKEECRVLILGCGNSRLGEDMLRDGWTGGITNIDFSPAVISQMRERYDKTIQRKLDNVSRSKKHGGITLAEHNRRMKYICGDVANGLDFADSSFDLIIHKGLLDAMTCHFMRNYHIKSLMNECTRLLDQSGAMVCISSGKRESRLEYLEHNDWSGGIWVKEVQKSEMYELRDDNENSK